MGAAESKVGVQPHSLAPVVTAGSPPAATRGFVTCNFLRKQNKTAPATTPPPTISSTTTPRSSPTLQAVREARPHSSAESAGPSVQLLTENKVVSLHQLTPDELGTQLLKAVKNGDLKLVQRIAEIASARQLSLINIRGMWESTPLIYACQYCHEPVALWLLDAGADVLAVNERGVTALLLASLEGMTDAVRRMLERQPTNEDTTAIDTQVGVVYNSAADLNVRASPLLAASMNGHTPVVRLLLEGHADVNKGVPAAVGATVSSRAAQGGGAALQFPLLVAAKYGHAEVVELLMNSGADISETDANENHALLVACEAAKDDCALALLRLLPPDEGVTWRRANCHGFTALHYCAVHGLMKAAEFMLHELAWSTDTEFLNATSSTRHESAVLMACRKKQHDVVKLLLCAGANALLADRGNTSALDVLKREKRDELIQFWEKRVASEALVQGSAKTPPPTTDAMDGPVNDVASDHDQEGSVSRRDRNSSNQIGDEERSTAEQRIHDPPLVIPPPASEEMAAATRETVEPAAERSPLEVAFPPASSATTLEVTNDVEANALSQLACPVEGSGAPLEHTKGLGGSDDGERASAVPDSSAMSFLSAEGEVHVDPTTVSQQTTALVNKENTSSATQQPSPRKDRHKHKKRKSRHSSKKTLDTSHVAPKEQSTGTDPSLQEQVSSIHTPSSVQRDHQGDLDDDF